MSPARSEFHIHLFGPRTAGQHQPLPVPTSFEAAIQRLLAEFPSVLTEPDGSVAWASPEHQLAAMLYDAAGEIQYVEIWGFADPGRFRRFVEVIVGSCEVDSFAVMTLPDFQWKDLQSFEKELTS